MVIDGHNDLVLQRWRGETGKHIDLDTAAESGFAGGFFALYVPAPYNGDPPVPPYAMPLAGEIPFDEAARVAEELFETLCAMPVRRARSVGDFHPGEVTAIVHMEGAEAIADDLSNLTDAGRALVRAGEELGILVDVSHLNERGFWDVAATSGRPIVATHSNAHALCASTRNLTDAQLDAVRDSGGVVGVNFAVTFLREDGLNSFEETGLEEIVRHVDYFADRMGIDHVAFGSDFDGAVVPAALGGVSGLPRLVDALRERYDADEVDRITHGNWLRVLDATWQ